MCTCISKHTQLHMHAPHMHAHKRMESLSEKCPKRFESNQEKLSERKREHQRVGRVRQQLAWNPSENCRFICRPGRSQEAADTKEVGERRVKTQWKMKLRVAKERITERGATLQIGKLLTHVSGCRRQKTKTLQPSESYRKQLDQQQTSQQPWQKLGHRCLSRHREKPCSPRMCSYWWGVVKEWGEDFEMDKMCYP